MEASEGTEEGTPQHGAWYVVASVPNLGDYDLSRIEGGTGCSSAVVAAAEVPVPPALDGEYLGCGCDFQILVACRGRATDGFLPVTIGPGWDSPIWFTELGLRADHIAWRRYDRHFRHRLAVSAVNYWQEGFGAEWYPQVRYEHEWQLAAGRQIGYGFGYARPVYDGVREDRVSFDLRVAWGE